MKQNVIHPGKWYNLGDADHRTYGGMFVRLEGDDIEVVEIRNYKEDYDGEGYGMDVRSVPLDEVKEVWKIWKKHPKRSSVGRAADWGQMEHLDTEKTQMWLYYFIARDIMLFYGGETDTYCGDNYWKLLKQEGIRRDNIIT